MSANDLFETFYDDPKAWRYHYLASRSFFFQAEDGIRDGHVTGVQTCALPISVTAQSFVDAWNYGANGANGQYASSFFEAIEGYADISDADADPEATLSGLEVVDDLTFTVTLSSPQADFPVRLGYTAFSPLPQAFFDDPEAFGESPIGNGPYQLVEWNHNQNAVLEVNPDYAGPRTPANDGLAFVFYQDRSEERRVGKE